MKVIKFVHPKWTNYFLKKLDSQILDVGPMFDRNLNFFLNWCRLFQTPMPCVHLKLSNCHWDILNKISLSLSDYFLSLSFYFSLLYFHLFKCRSLLLSFFYLKQIFDHLFEKCPNDFFCQNRLFQNDFLEKRNRRIEN